MKLEYKPAAPAVHIRGKFVGRTRAQDAAYQFRAPGGFPGMVTRTHPFGDEPCLLDPTNPPTFYGEAVITSASGNSVRTLLSSDTGVTDIYGVTIRPYPFQQSLAAIAFGQANFSTNPATSPIQTNQVVDILRQGYIMVPCVGSPVKGGAVYVWIAASSGAHTQGGFEAVSSGSTITLAWDKTTFNGPPDSNGLVELAFNV